MTGELPDYYFRVRENGALVFRVEAETRMRRIEMDQIATVNVRNGEIRPHGDRRLTEADVAAIRDWMDDRVRQLAVRELDDIRRSVDQLNLTAQWLHGRATDEQVEEVADALLLAMHDLRAVLVRRRADSRLRQRTAAGDAAADEDPS